MWKERGKRIEKERKENDVGREREKKAKMAWPLRKKTMFLIYLNQR